MEEERNQKLKQLSDARERQKREIQENKMRRVQLAESCEFFRGESNFQLNEYAGVSTETRTLKCNGTGKRRNKRVFFHLSTLSRIDYGILFL